LRGSDERIEVSFQITREEEREYPRLLEKARADQKAHARSRFVKPRAGQMQFVGSLFSEEEFEKIFASLYLPPILPDEEES